ncbi:hypothetical protein [Actinoplanes sp. URMC 104]|uniref:hypothetical protein n=1 Tax=Actinoplanes sp. URMC 104 TaxID=3423409 RepID=UPI003F1DAC40
MSTYMAHTLTEADQIERPDLTGEAAHDEVCRWLGFHSGPTVTDDIPALSGMYLHLAGILRAELPEFACATPGAAFVVEGWEQESEVTRQLYDPETGLLPQAMRATKVGSVNHRDLTLAVALAADLDQLKGCGLDPERLETFAGLFTQVQYWPGSSPFTARIFCRAISESDGQRSVPVGLVGELAFLQPLDNGRTDLVTFECWINEKICTRVTREIIAPSIRAAADQLRLGSVDLLPSRTVRADLLSIMLPSKGSAFVASDPDCSAPGDS